jgi:hypothetical protein
MNELGKVLLSVSAVLAALGLMLLLGGRIHLPFGRLPGDIIYRGKHTTFYFPIVTSLLLNLVLLAVLYLLGRLSR